MSIQYNLEKYLSTALPTLNFCVDGFHQTTQDDVLNITSSGGEVQHYYDRIDHRVQILSRALNQVTAQANALTVFNLIKNKFGLELPAVTVESVVYPAVMTWQISPLQSPGYIGADDRGLSLYSFNVMIVTK